MQLYIMLWVVGLIPAVKKIFKKIFFHRKFSRFFTQYYNAKMIIWQGKLSALPSV